MTVYILDTVLYSKHTSSKSLGFVIVAALSVLKKAIFINQVEFMWLGKRIAKVLQNMYKKNYVPLQVQIGS